MSTITVPLTPELEKFINSQLALGKAKSKSELVRRALQNLKEEEFITTVVFAQREIAEGKALVGDLDELAKGF